MADKITVKSRYGDERVFEILSSDKIAYVFTDDCVGMSMNAEGKLSSVDPSGGPYIAIDTNLGEVHKELEGLTVTEIKRSDTKSGSYYLTVQ
jgi:hypothetical protein